ncbi:hypothetical protein [Candidatus Protochlamydia phocaeensis]|uniref:hypothetical protein n=1 Tax=Candidatus Protochlamydia phocaeensis TaxID=1414722 RepID=UPI000838971C|nr:hypothetical protein [Candidatus Protochlamydia phocaeensis]
MSNPRVTGPSGNSSPIPPDYPDIGINGQIEKDQVETVTNEKAQETLKNPPKSNFSYYKFWTWNLFKKADTPASDTQTQVTQNSNSLIVKEEGKGKDQGSEVSDDEGGIEDESGKNESGAQASFEQDLKEFESELPLSQIPGNLIQEEGNSFPTLDVKEKKFEKTTEKTAQTGNRFWNALSSVGGAVHSVGGAIVGKGWDLAKAGGRLAQHQGENLVQWGKETGTNALKSYLNNYAKNLDKASYIAHAHERIRTALPKDPQFIELAGFLTDQLQKVAQSNLPKEGWLGDNLQEQQALISTLIEINLARGMANLAEQIEQNKETIPNYDKQPALVSILSLFCKKAESHINMEKLASIEEKYQANREEYKRLQQKLFPDLDKKPASQQVIQEIIQGNKDFSEALELFPDLAKLVPADAQFLPFSLLNQMLIKNVENHEEERLKDIEAGYPSLLGQLADFQAFAQVLAGERKRHQELQQIMQLLTDDILTYLFPNKVQDVVIPRFGLLNISYAQNYLYNNIRDLVAAFLQKSYEPLALDIDRRKKWEEVVQNRIGSQVSIPDLMIAPTNFLVGYGKNYIQSDPRAINLVEWALSAVAEPTKEGEANPANITKNQVLSNLSQAELAGWLVESAQAMLHTQDPHLLNAGFFIQSVLNELTLGLLAKGAEVLIPEGHQVKEDQLVKELAERIYDHYKSLQQGKAVPEAFWENIVKDLPLPPTLKNLIAKKLVEQAEKYQKTLRENTILEEVRALHANALKKFSGYENAGQFIAISETISNQLVKTVLENNIDLVSKWGAGQTIEELVEQYLPGIKVSDELKKWLKNNISALSSEEEGQIAEPVALIKQGIQAVILTALSNTIEMNFSNSELYAAQLLKNIHTSVQKAFPSFTEEQKKELRAAIDLQDKIRANKAQIEELRKLAADQPFKGLDWLQINLIKQVLRSEQLATRADDYVTSLEAKKNDILEKLRVNSPLAWDDSELDKIRSALAFRQVVQQELAEARAQKPSLTEMAFLMEKRDRLNADKELEKELASDTKKTAQELAQYEILIGLLNYPTEKLQLISDVLNIDKTLQHARLELEHLNKDLEQAHQNVQFENMSLDKTNKKEWSAAINWMGKILDSRRTTKQLIAENQELAQELEAHMEPFRLLANELTALIGLEQKNKLGLPAVLENRIWPLIEQAKEKTIPLILFDQVSPMLLPVMEIEENRAKLQKLAQGNKLLSDLSHATAEDLIGKIPDFITSYRPFADLILKVAKYTNRSASNISRMDKALRATMLKLGKEVIVADRIKSLLGDKVAADRVNAVAETLYQATQAAGPEGVTKTTIFRLLKQENPKEAVNILDKKAQELAYQLNTLLINSGKTKLTEEHLIEAYTTFSGANLTAAEKEELIKDLEKEEAVTKIQRVVISPEEIARFINDAIPGATELHALLAPQIQAVISGDDKTFEENRGFAKQYVEAMILRLCVKIASANEGENVLAVLTEKLKNMALDSDLIENKTREEAARIMIDKAFSDIAGIESEADLKGVPLALQKLVYKTLKEQAYLQISPMLFPMIERTQNKQLLDRLSGSKMMSNLAKALANDVMYLLPAGLSSYLPITKQLWVDLSGKEPTNEQVEAFADKIREMMKNSPDKHVYNRKLFELYEAVSQTTLTDEQKTNLRKTLNEKGYKSKIQNIKITPEELAESLGNFLPHIEGSLQKSVAEAFQDLTRNESEAYQNISGFAGQYIEGMLLRIFIKIAEKNPRERGKDSLVVLTERLLNLATSKYQETKDRNFEEVAKELNDAVLKDVLGINSKEDLEGLPPPLKAKVYNALKDVLGTMAVKVYSGLKTLDSDQPAIKEARKELKRFGVEENSQRAYADILAEDLANMVVSAVPHTLTEIAGGTNMRGVTLISKSVQDHLQELSRGNLQVAGLLLNYAKAPLFETMLSNNLAKIGDPNQLVTDKKKAADLISNLVVVPLNGVLSKAVDFEKQRGADFNRKLMVNVLKVATNHWKTLNEAKKLAALEGRSHISHADFVKSSPQLHPAVPVAPVSYAQSLAAIKEKLQGALTDEQLDRLEKEIREMVKAEEKDIKIFTAQDLIDKINEIKGEPISDARRRALKKINPVTNKSVMDLIHEEAQAIKKQRQEAFYDPTSRLLLKMIFPKGKDDLEFVPEELRKQTWKILKKNLFPKMLPMIMETVLEQNKLKKMVLKSLETLKDNLDQEIVLDHTPPEDPSLDELDAASGALMVEVLETIELPSWIKKKLKDPRTGEVNPALVRSLGATLRKQFNETFIKDKLEVALKAAVQRDEHGNPTLHYDTSSQAEKAEARRREGAALDVRLRKTSRELVDSSISYFIRSTWKKAQAKFDRAIQGIAGKFGMKIKRALDAVFRFVFFKIIGTALAFLFSPIKDWAKNKLYDYIMLDRNRDSIMEFLTRIPEDQPVESLHAVYNEDLAYKLAEALRTTVEDVMKTPIPEPKRRPPRGPDLTSAAPAA